MSDKPENPPAFPIPASCSPMGDYLTPIAWGMTLRDHFAGLAMQAYAANNPSKTGLNAALAYAQADEMLKGRQE